MVPHFVIWPDYMRTKHFTIIDVNRVTRLSGNGSHGQQLSRTFLFLVLLCPFREIRVAVLPDLRLQQPQEQRYPFLAVCVVFSFVQTMVWLPVFGILTSAQMLIHAIAHVGCADTGRESPLEVNTVGENPLSHQGLEPASVLRLAFGLNKVYLHS